MKKQLVKLWERPSYDGCSFTYYLIYIDENGKRRQKSLAHSDARKAERQRAKFERHLRMGCVESQSLSLCEFLRISLERSLGQVRESTLVQQDIAMRHLIETVGNINTQNVKLRHGEIFIRTCLDMGNSRATVNKKIRSLKRLFQLGVERELIESNPFARIQKPKASRKKIRIYGEKECAQLIRSSRIFTRPDWLPWDLLILTALSTAMRRGELLNTTWGDIDFEKQIIEVSPKKNTRQTWEWHIKDTDRRTLPLTENVLALLAEHQAKQPEGYPYVFLPTGRYNHLQKIRTDNHWKQRYADCPVNNFTRVFKKIQQHAGVDNGEFHDLRRTCLTNWLTSGLGEYDVMHLAGHADFQTTHRFYLAVREDLLDRTREITQTTFVANLLQYPSEAAGAKATRGISP